MIYLDNAATTYPKFNDVYNAIDNANRNLLFNPGRGCYKKANQAAQLKQSAKDKLREILHLNAEIPIVFSPSITIALFQIIRGLDFPENADVYISPFEHNAVARTLYALQKEKNIQIHLLPMDPVTLEIPMENVRYEFSRVKPYAVICTHISNVTGYMLPIEEIFAEAKHYGAVTVLDTAQSFGTLDFPPDLLEQTDLLAFTAHKSLYGPIGIGGFINLNKIPLQRILTGGTGTDSLNLEMPNSVEEGYEPASFNTSAVAGLMAALDHYDPSESFSHQAHLTHCLVEGLMEYPEIRILKPEDPSRHIGIVSFVVEGCDSNDIGTMLEGDYDIAVRTGYHCAPYVHDFLHDKSSNGTVRVSVGRFTTQEDVDGFIKAIENILLEL